MGRRTLAQLILNELKSDEKESKEAPPVGEWIVFYDFRYKKTQRGFWDNLHRVSNITGVGYLIQLSAYVTSDWIGAQTVVKLAQHYEGIVACYKIEREIEIT